MCNILTKTQLKTVGLSNTKIKPTNTLLRAYTGDKLQVTGVCTLKAKKNNRIYKIDFYVVETKIPVILGLSSCLELEIIEKINNINEENSYAGVLKEYKEIYLGIGCLSRLYHIKLKEKAQPVIHPTRRVAHPR